MKTKLGIFTFYASVYPVRSVLMIISLALAGFLEGLGILTLLPLITTLIDSADQSGGFIADMATAVFNLFGLDPGLHTALMLIVCFMFLKAAVNMVAISLIANTAAHISADLRLSFIRTLLSARWSHYINLKSGATANAIGTEARRAALSFKQACQLFANGVQILVYGGLALLVSWELTAMACFTGIIMVLALGVLVRKSRQAGQKMTSIFENVLGFVTDAFFGAKPLKAMNKEKHLLKLLKKDIEDLQKSERRLEIIDQSLWVLSEPLIVIFVAAGMLAAFTYANLPVAELLFMAVIFLRMVMRVSNAQRAYQMMVSNESALWSILDKIKRAEDDVEDFKGSKEPQLASKLDIKNITFGYDETKILDKFSLALSAKKLHVIFGPSGTGKTTLIDLIIGLNLPESGEIWIDDIEIRDVNIGKWRQKVGYVPQDVLLFHDTLLKNMTLNDETVTEDAAIAALKRAGAWEFVKDLPDGLDTVVGERGSRFSGGQRQRIAIARAIINNPDLLILDEATSALDPETEKQVLNTVKILSADMTVVAISHNRAILDVADNVVDLSKDTAAEIAETVKASS